MGLAERLELFDGGRRGIDDVAVVPHLHLGLAVGALEALGGRAEIVGHLGAFRIDVVVEVRQVAREGAPQIAVLLARVEVLSVDPDEVDGAFRHARLHLARQLRENVVDVHADQIERDVVLVLQRRGQHRVDPGVARLVAAVAVPRDRLSLGRSEHRVPVGVVDVARYRRAALGRLLARPGAPRKRSAEHHRRRRHACSGHKPATAHPRRRETKRPWAIFALNHSSSRFQ